MSNDQLDPALALHRLYYEVKELQQEQIDRLKHATFVGMTPAEAKEYDARRERIMKLSRQISELQSRLGQK